jgi:hemerythrin
MTWNERMRIGIAALDEQHRCLVDRVNELHTELSLSVPNRRNIGEILESLVDEAMNHFVAEEKIFQRGAGPASAADLAERNGFTSKVMTVLDMFQHESPAACLDALAALSDWLAQHITVIDQVRAPRAGALCVH